MFEVGKDIFRHGFTGARGDGLARRRLWVMYSVFFVVFAIFVCRTLQKVKHELNDEEVITIIAREIKTRKESIKEFEKGGRTDLIEKTAREVEILNKYMPAQMSEEEVIKIIDEVFSKVNPVGPSDMGKIMGAIAPLIKGKADLGFVNTKVKEKLSQL